MNSTPTVERLLQNWLADEAPITPPPDLHRQAMQTVRAARQRPAWAVALRPVAMRQPRTDARLLLRFALLLGLMLIAGMLVVLSVGDVSPPPPTPSPTAPGNLATNFIVPFTYTNPTSEEVVWVTRTGHVTGFVFPAPAEIDERGYGSNQAGDAHGVVVAWLAAPWVHTCDGSRADVRAHGRDLFAALDTAGGIRYGPVADLNIDGRPAIEARRLGTDCSPDVHPAQIGPQNYVSMKTIGESILVDVDSQPVLIDVWAANNVALDAWLPTGMNFVSSMHFVEGP